MKRVFFLGLLGLCLFSTTLQSCDKDNPGPNGSNGTDSTYVDSTGNGDYDGPTCGDSTDWNGGNNGNGSDSTDWNGGDPGNDTDSTDWNGGNNPNDSLPQ